MTYVTIWFICETVMRSLSAYISMYVRPSPARDSELYTVTSLGKPSKVRTMGNILVTFPSQEEQQLVPLERRIHCPSFRAVLSVGCVVIAVHMSRQTNWWIRGLGAGLGRWWKFTQSDKKDWRGVNTEMSEALDVAPARSWNFRDPSGHAKSLNGPKLGSKSGCVLWDVCSTGENYNYWT
jgi:hypothetical protein